MSEPREYAISRADLASEDVICDLALIHNFPDRDFIHVIEKSAYDRLLAQAEKLAETLTEAIEDLENLGHTAIAADLRRQALFEETKE